MNAPAITLSPTTLPAATAEKSYSQTITASGGTSPYTYTESGSLPSGITFSSGKFSGTPTVTGSFPVTVTAKDKYSFTGSQNYTLTVNAPAIMLSPTTLPAATAEKSYSQTITASGGTTPYTYTESGSLPSGITFSSGKFSGTPTITGSFPVTVTAKDKYSFTGSQSYTLTVNAPIITLSPTTLPYATKGKSYSQTITASGGTSPYTYTESGSLPSGITFSSGKLSGTPTVTGSFPVTITAKDNYSFTGTQSYTLTVSS